MTSSEINSQVTIVSIFYWLYINHYDLWVLEKNIFCKLFFLRLTTPSGSTSRRCLGRPQCMPVSTYCPGLVVLSRTRKSPSRTRSFSASRRLMRLWYQGSLRSCSSFGATGARRRGGLGHWSSRIRTLPPAAWAPPAAADILESTTPPLASWSFRASSNGPAGTLMFHHENVVTQQYFLITCSKIILTVPARINQTKS